MFVNKEIYRGDDVDLVFTVDKDYSAKKIIFIAKTSKDFASARAIEKKNTAAGGSDLELEVSATEITVHLVEGNTQGLNYDYVYYDIFNDTDNETIINGRIFLKADVQTPYDSGYPPSDVLPLLVKAIYGVIEDGVLTTFVNYGFNDTPLGAISDGTTLTITSTSELDLEGNFEANNQDYSLTQTDENSIVVTWTSLSGQTISFWWRLYSATLQSTPISYSQRTWGTTAQRPTLGANDIGFEYYDTDIGAPVWWDGSNWTDS